MKQLFHNIITSDNKRRGCFSLIMIVIAVMLFGGTDCFAYSQDHYAVESKLNSGKWVRIRIKEEGLQFLSKTTLASMGFSSPEKVKVFGYGGKLISEKMNELMPDDLPEVPVCRVDNGILFYGAGLTVWTPNTNYQTGQKYSHEINPYGKASYYFLTEDDAPDMQIPVIDGSADASAVAQTEFRARLCHETDQFSGGVSGRELFGEDFRSVRTRTFPFVLEGNVGGDVTFHVKFFGERNSNIAISANDKRVSSKTDSKTDSSVSYAYYTLTGSFAEKDDNLRYQLAYSPGAGGAGNAYLDYIEIEYDRRLALTGNGLHFYEIINQPVTFEVSGCTSATKIWDVTDPAAIKEIKYSLNGGKGVFSITEAGYREFIAFNPKGSGSVPENAGAVQNQNLHGVETPHMVIITLPEFMAQSKEIASMHEKHDGMEVLVVEPQSIYNEFSSGVADVSAFRKFLKMLYDRGLDSKGDSKLGYCLLMGAATYDNRGLTDQIKNCGYDVLPIYQSKGAPGELGSYSTDDLIAQLDDESEGIAKDKMSIAIGRIPARSKEDADNAVRKIKNYMEDLELGSWRNNVMMIADDQNSAAHLDQSEAAYNSIMSAGGSGLKFDKIYLDAFDRVSSPLGLTFPAARSKMLERWKEGVMFICYVGHGSPRTWTHENLLTWSDVNSLVNRRMPFLYAATCEFARWDDDTPSAAEVMLFNPKGGVIAMICPSRSVYISNNGVFTQRISKFFFERDAEGNGPRMGDIMKNGKNAMVPDDSNKLRFCMLGDPALRLKLPENISKIETIGDSDMTAESAEVVLQALDNKTMSGVIVTPNGEVDNSFNGVIELTLMDASEVIETHGWEDETGNNGKVSYYNDRLNRLSVGRTRVVDGKWETTMYLPRDIDNNTAPAQILTYAYDAETGREANSSNENVYVYGYNDNIDIDEDGPEIKSFVLNNAGFSDGDLVQTSPLVFASFKDEQGINVSDTGIGHKIMLTLDRKTYFDDVNQYYSPDLEDPSAGAITYPLNDLEAGDHTLTLTVWDNANNSTSATISFKVGVNMNPGILDVSSRLDDEAQAVIFSVQTDMANDNVDCGIEIFNLSGQKVWESADESSVGSDNKLTVKWNMQDMAGRRVPRGIYVYRATVFTPEGRKSSKSKKLAVGSPLK